MNIILAIKRAALLLKYLFNILLLLKLNLIKQLIVFFINIIINIILNFDFNNIFKICYHALFSFLKIYEKNLFISN